MNSANLGLKVASVIFLIFALLQLARLLSRIDIVVGGYSMPLASNAVALVIAGALGIWMWRLAKSVSR